MKKFLMVVILAVAAVAGAADVYKESVASSGLSACTAANLARRQYAVQCDGQAYVAVGSVATTNDFKLDTEKLYDVYMPDSSSKICVLRVAGSGTLTCKIFTVDPQFLLLK